MSKITLDTDLRAKLNGLNEPMELCDESGSVVGHFLPVELYREMLFAWADSLVPPEEWERLRQEKGGRSLAEIWKSLGRT